MRIGFVMLRHGRSRVSPVMAEVTSLLSEWGVHIDLVHPEQAVVDLRRIRVDHDLYVLKSGTAMALTYAGMLDALGARLVNTYATTARCRDKIIATRLLQEAMVPVPDTFISVHPAQLAPLLDDGPLVVKPHRGSQGRGVQVVWDADELQDVATSDGPVFAQRYTQHQGRDRKLYSIGGQLFGVKRVWPARNYEDRVGEPFTVTPELHDIAVRTGTAFGLDLFGLDIVVSDGRPYVVDINPFPGFKGVPDAALRLANYIYTEARQGAERAEDGPVGQDLVEV